MKPLTELTREDIKNIKLLAFDVDGVTIKKGTDLKAGKFYTTKSLEYGGEELIDKLLELSE